ncbi:MAG: MFS transporter, partial [Gammaproteobacteria bacterium]
LLAGGGLSTTALVGTILMSGFAAGAEVDLMGFLVARYFGLRHFGKIYAAIYIGFALAPGITTPMLGAARDHYGNYSAGLYVAAVALVGAALLFVSLGPYPKLPESQQPA